MVITEELARKIVLTVMPVVHRNVNIMNRQGTIIGTGQPERLGTFHKGALDAVESGSAIEIHPDEVCHYPGARQGVNLPIFLEGQIVGVVGVFGVPDEVRGMASMVKLVTELILEQELSQREAQVRSHLREEFLQAALHHGGRELPAKVRRLAKAIGIHLEGRHCVCIADLTPLHQQMLPEYGASGLLEERMAEMVEGQLQQQGLIKPEDLLSLCEDRLTVLREISDGEDASKSIPSWLWKVHTLLSGICKGPISCAAGGVVHNAVDYPASHGQALFCLARCNDKRPCRSLFDRVLLVHYLASQVANGPSGIALSSFEDLFRTAAGEKKYLRETLSALLDCNLDSGRTADQLGIHRNSLAYRLQRIRDELNLDPVNRTADVLLTFALLER